MDHTQFKANQTAATYVADGLDEGTLEAFEMHMMGCTECIEDVEAWRAIKLNMPRRARPALAPAALRRSVQAAAGWRMAASLLIAAILGAAGGWLGMAAMSSDAASRPRPGTRRLNRSISWRTRAGSPSRAMRNTSCKRNQIVCRFSNSSVTRGPTRTRR